MQRPKRKAPSMRQWSRFKNSNGALKAGPQNSSGRGASAYNVDRTGWSPRKLVSRHLNRSLGRRSRVHSPSRMKFFDLYNFDQGRRHPKGNAPIRSASLLRASSKSARCTMPEFQPISSALVSAIERPSCPKCRHHRMLLSKLESGPPASPAVPSSARSAGMSAPRTHHPIP